MFKNILNTLAGNPYERELKRYRETVTLINDLEPEMQSRSDSDLRALIESLREHVRAATDGIEDPAERQTAERAALDEILPQVFAAVREASRRALGLRHFDVQMIGGIALHEGKVSEMKTGEGKTLVASLPLVLNALSGRGAHLVTVNDYLAQRDGGWMGPIYHLLGLTVGAIGKEQFSAVFDPDYVDPGGDLQDSRLVHWRPTLRRQCYEADITYGTAPEFGFDYLRDNTALEPERMVQRELVYAIVDEADSVLIDGARTPLIISGPAGTASTEYQRFAKLIEDARLRRNTTDLVHDEEPDGDYVLDDRTQTVSLTDRGIEKVEETLPEINTSAGQSLYDPQYYQLVHFLENALKARYVFKRDRDYIVQDGKVVLVDQTTGRPMPSRRYSEGLHQAIEAREGVQVRREDVTIATITVQNYFRLYEKLAGMTGTAMTQAEEFDTVYTLDVVAIPTNIEYLANEGVYEPRREKVEGVPAVTFYRPGEDGPAYYQRIDYPDQVYTSIKGKFNAVAEEINDMHEQGQPVLVGTGSVEASEELSRILKGMSLPHEVLNAKQHDREALIVAQAGRAGAITISTSMAGRGTDILLGGNPEGLAASYVAEACFTLAAFSPVVTDVINGDMDSARRRAAADPLMGEEIVDWIADAYQEIKAKVEVEDVLGQVVADLREDPAYKDIPYETLVAVTQQIGLAALDQRRLDKARQIAEAQGAPLSLIPEAQFRLNEYYSLKALLGQVGLAQTLARRMFERHYNARAALTRAVLANDLDEARRLIASFPALPEHLIEGVQAIVQECAQTRRAVWEKGGLHIIGTERHESRRIDNQLRGRAGRQGDPGASRFYLSLEDDLMIRFGGERSKAIFDRLNVPEDMPISANILSNMIENAQARFEQFYFEMRKNLVEYDEAVNRQRQLVYDDRRAILEGSTEALDDLVRQYTAETLERLIARLRDDYEGWALAEIQQVIEDFSNIDTGEVNTRGAVQRVLALIPRPSPEQMEELLAIEDAGALADSLHGLVLDGVDAGHHLNMLYAEVMRIVPLWPPLPLVTPGGVEGWESYLAAARDSVMRAMDDFTEDDQSAVWGDVKNALDESLRVYLGSASRGMRPQDAQAAFYGQITGAYVGVFRAIVSTLETEELIDLLLARVDELLALARQTENPAIPALAIGPDELARYQRALMLSVIDGEWRQYLVAIDDLRQGIGLEAFGQRDPKVEFKRRAADMFDSLRADVQEGIARRFWNDLPRHRQIIDSQKQQEAMLDRLAQSGYRVQVKARPAEGGQPGQARLTQTVRKDLWANVGRNDPCPCGSGKKFKDCHYQQMRTQQMTVDQGAVQRGGAGKKRGRRRR